MLPTEARHITSFISFRFLFFHLYLIDDFNIMFP